MVPSVHYYTPEYTSGMVEYTVTPCVIATIYTTKECVVMDYKAMRHRAGLSLNDIAVRTGYSKSQVAKVEAGLVHPSKQYQAAFQIAVNSLDMPSSEKQVPLTKLTAELTVQLTRARELQEELKRNIFKGNSLIKAHETILDIVYTLTQQQSQRANSQTDIDLTTADPEVRAQAEDHITTAVTEALQHWNIHKLPEKVRETAVRHLMEEVLEKLKPNN